MNARKKKLFTPAQEIELEGLRQNSVHPRHRAMSAKPLAEAQKLPEDLLQDEAIVPNLYGHFACRDEAVIFWNTYGIM